MKKFVNYLMIILFVPALVLSSCKKDEDEPENKAPIANAGVDQTVQMGTEVTLNGTASSDPEGSALTYSWTEANGITLSSTTDAEPTFTAPDVTEETDYVFSLTVNDGSLTSAPDEVTVTVSPEEVIYGFPILKDYLINNFMDIDSVINNWIISAAGVYGKGITDFYIMDIRSVEDYDAGHIEGAVNSSLGTIVDDAASADKPILVVCYTGQTAAHAVVALRLSGYMDAKTMKWGMCSWHEDFAGKWNDNIGNTASDYPDSWTSDPTADLQTFTEPTWTATSEVGAEILAARVSEFIAAGFNGVGSTDVLADPSVYFINNYWAQADVDLYGHIVDAYRIKPLTLAGDEFLNLDPSQTIVTYCWTGQTSSMMTAYLEIIGYNSLSLKFGTNAMIYDDLQGHKWSDSEIMGYDYVTGK